MRRLNEAAVYRSLSSVSLLLSGRPATLFKWLFSYVIVSFCLFLLITLGCHGLDKKTSYWQGCLRSLLRVCIFPPYMSHVYKCCPRGGFYGSSSSSVVNSASRATWWPKKDDRELFCSVLTSCFNKNCRCLQIHNHTSSTNLFTVSHHNHYIKRKKKGICLTPACLIIPWPYTNAGARQACGLWDRKASKQTA